MATVISTSHLKLLLSHEKAPVVPVASENSAA